ncbi:MAG: FecR domain-containing protein [Chitinophagaceae bacterium]|nr:FecR domain-containing protein [Chitinophagaceae bacterium]
MQEAQKELLIRFFQNKCTPEELTEAHQLLQQPDAEAFLKELALQEWDQPVEKSAALHSLQQNWKEKLNARILAENKTIQKPGIVKRLYRFRHAAVWLGLLLVSSAVLWHYLGRNEEKMVALIEKKNESGIPRKFILPDSSEVFLAAGSKVHYPASFTGATREIDLEGEAFFDIKPNAGQPFIIHTGNAYTKVLGTSFRISFIWNRPLEVAVATGKVAVDLGNQSLTTLTPGHKVTWYAAEQTAITSKVDANSLTNWRDGELMFDRLSMAQIVEELQNRYKVQIEIIDGSVENNRVSGTFAASKTIDQVLKALAVAGKFRYETDNNKSFRIFQLK